MTSFQSTDGLKKHELRNTGFFSNNSSFVEKNPENLTTISFMVFKKFSSNFYCYGIKMSTKNRILLSFVFLNTAFSTMSATFLDSAIYAEAMIYYIIT